MNRLQRCLAYIIACGGALSRDRILAGYHAQVIDGLHSKGFVDCKQGCYAPTEAGLAFLNDRSPT